MSIEDDITPKIDSKSNQIYYEPIGFDFTHNRYWPNGSPKELPDNCYDIMFIGKRGPFTISYTEDQMRSLLLKFLPIMPLKK